MEHAIEIFHFLLDKQLHSNSFQNQVIFCDRRFNRYEWNYTAPQRSEDQG